MTFCSSLIEIYLLFFFIIMILSHNKIIYASLINNYNFPWEIADWHLMEEKLFQSHVCTWCTQNIKKCITTLKTLYNSEKRKQYRWSDYRMPIICSPPPILMGVRSFFEKFMGSQMTFSWKSRYMPNGGT